jgi:hypothetical protein
MEPPAQPAAVTRYSLEQPQARRSSCRPQDGQNRRLRRHSKACF